VNAEEGKSRTINAEKAQEKDKEEPQINTENADQKKTEEEPRINADNTDQTEFRKENVRTGFL
jgi:hypothetical protein